MGADTKANTLELVRVPSSLLQRLQCGVALESLCDHGCSFGTEPVVLKTAAEGVRWWGGEPCQRALTLKQTLWGGGALQLLDLRLLEDGGERGGALVSNLVEPQTVSEEQSGDGERYQECQWALTRKRTLWGGGALELGDLRLLGTAASAIAPLAPIMLPSRLCETGQDGERIGRVNGR